MPALLCWHFLIKDLILNGKPRKLDGGRGRDDVLGGNQDQLDFGRFINHFHSSPSVHQFFEAYASAATP